jgi:asparagine synthase (glutamine-hydrolysing)
MCGIFGIIGGKPLNLAGLAARMAPTLSHRGPDDEGFHIDGTAMLGNRRLSIIDIAHGHQPMFSADKKIAVVQNGEIYNYIELQNELKARGVTFSTDSDTEVILRLYETYGVDFVSRLNGMFAIAVWDAHTESMHLFRDRLGIKPLFLARYDAGIAFASEIKALLAAGVPTRQRMEAIHHYLSFNYVPPCMTMFEHIEHVPAGSAATIRHGKIHSWQWWQPSLATQEKSEKYWAEALAATLEEAVRIHLRSDVEVGAFLSGGVDSSTVVALSAKYVKPPMHSFSIGFDDPRFDESAYSEMAAKQYRTQHHLEKAREDMMSLWPKAIYFCEQPHGDASFVPTYLLSELAARRVKVVVTGDGGDELFAGYERYIPFIAEYGSSAPDAFERAYFANQGMISHAEKLALYTPEYKKRFASLDSFALMQPDFAEARALDPVNRMLWMDLKWLLPGNNLVKPDRMGMSVGLEARVPFLDSHMIDLALSMPGHMKLKGGITKYILKHAMRAKLPHELLHRPKQMFTVPIGEWFRSHLAPLMERVLLSEAARARGLFDAAAVRRLMDEHISGTQNHTRLLRALMATEIWYRLYIDGERSDSMPEFMPERRADLKASRFSD